MLVKKVLLILAAVLSIGLAACSPGGGATPTIPINTFGPTLRPSSLPSTLPSTMPSEMPSGSSSPSAT